MSRPIEDYALISDCHSAALVAKDGSIDWLCFPAFDSSACFASLLGDNENGRWIITPKEKYTIERRYLEDTVVLETTYKTSKGSFKIIDCMLYGEKHPTIIRSVEGIEGKVEVVQELIIRFDYGSIVPWVRRNKDGDGIHSVGGPEGLVYYSPLPLKQENDQATNSFTISAGDNIPFTLTWYQSHEPIPEPQADAGKAIEKTILWWREWASKSTYKGFDEEGVKRSLLTLKAITYKPSGAILAAATTSLPETLGGVRNWDYRFGWIRDSSFTLLALLEAGFKEEAIHWEKWLLRAIAGNPDQVNIMYGIRGERRLNEFELDWLKGYENSQPVRIGNAAYKQLQLDVFGELMATSYLGRKYGIEVNEDAWRLENCMIEFVCENWQEPDEGIWEVRSSKKHFTHSKMMAWVALNAAVKSIHEFKLEGDLERWTKIRDEIHKDICEKGFSKKLNSFVQYYGSEELDGSLLMMALVDFLPAHDPRVIGTVNAIQKYLMKDGLVLRYRTDNTDDGLPGEEGTFLACSFWMVRNLCMMNRKEEALELYNKLSKIKNDVGLYAEEYSTDHKRMVGNFPQAFSHITHIGAAMEISRSFKE